MFITLYSIFSFKKYGIKLDPIKPALPLIIIACILIFYNYLNNYLIALEV